MYEPNINAAGRPASPEEAEIAEVACQLPPDLEQIPAGVELMQAVDGVDLNGLSNSDLVRLHTAHKRLIAHYQAMEMETMVEIVHAYSAEHGPETVEAAREFASAQIQVALKLTKTQANARLEMAETLIEGYPLVFALLRDGRLDLSQIGLISGSSNLATSQLRTAINLTSTYDSRPDVN